VRRLVALLAALAAIVLLADALPAQALTRGRANAIALAALGPQRLAGGAAVLGLPAPLPRGSYVDDAAVPAGTPLVGDARTSVEHLHPLRAPAWLFWEDDAYGAEFEHPGLILLVDDASGRVVARIPTRLYPLVNGRAAPFATPSGYASPRYRVWPSPTRPAQRRTAAARGGTGSRAPRLRLPNDCLVVIGDHVDARFEKNAARLKKVGADLGLGTVTEVNTVAALRTRIAQLVGGNPACTDVWIAIGGHGSSAKYTGLPTTSIRLSVKLGNGTEVKVEQDITGLDVANIIDDFKRQATFKVTVASCYAGRWVDYFRAIREPNLRVVVGSSSATEPSYFHQTEGVPGRPAASGGLPNTTTNPDGADEFTNGIATGLETALHNPADLALTGSDLGKLLVRAFQLELAGDFAAQLGWTHPQIYFNPNAAVVVPRQWEIAPVGQDSVVYSVDANGWTAGSSGATAPKPFVYTWRLGRPAVKPLKLPSGFSSGSAFGINAKGHATGSFEKPDGTSEHPFLYNGTSLRDLGTLGGALASGNAISSADEVVGSSLTSTPNTFHPFLWRAGVMHDLGTLGGANGSAFGIDDAGQVTGSASIPGPSGFHAFMWDGTMHDLGALPGYQWSAGLSIANGGMVAGYSMNPGGLQLATVWGAGGPLSLGTLPGDSGSVATGVNPGGWVVGRSFTDPRALPHPFLWTSGTMVPLQSLVPPSSGWKLFDATSIDALGQIGGEGSLDGRVRGFLLSPPLADALQPIGDRIESANLAKPLAQRTSLGYYVRAAIVALDENRPQRACGDLAAFAAAAPVERRAGRFADRATVARVAELRSSYGCG